MQTKERCKRYIERIGGNDNDHVSKRLCGGRTSGSSQEVSGYKYGTKCGIRRGSYCEKARARIREAIGREDADVHFLVGGTQTNLTVISAALRLIRERFVRKPGIFMCMRPDQ